MTLIETKSNLMTRYLAELESFLPPDPSSYTSSRCAQLQVERLCHLCVECAADINAAIAVCLGHPSPTSAREGVRALQHRVLTEHLADWFAYTYLPFRNRLVNEYKRINTSIVYHTAQRLIVDGREFLRQVIVWVNQQTSEPSNRRNTNAAESHNPQLAQEETT